MWDEGDLELGEVPVTQTKVINWLIRIRNKSITYNNAVPMKKRTLL